MYTTTVKIKRIFDGEVVKKIIITLGIWLILMDITLFIGIKYTPFALLFMVIIFFSIIPIIFFMRKSTDEFRGEKAFITQEVTFKTIDGELYVKNKKMNVKQNKSKTKIYIDDIRKVRTKYGRNTSYATFIGTIEEPYLKDFIKFLDEQGVKIQK